MMLILNCDKFYSTFLLCQAVTSAAEAASMSLCLMILVSFLVESYSYLVYCVFRGDSTSSSTTHTGDQVLLSLGDSG